MKKACLYVFLVREWLSLVQEQLNISKTQYNSIKPDLEHRFGWQVVYDKKDKCWRYVGVETTKEIEEKKKENAL